MPRAKKLSDYANDRKAGVERIFTNPASTVRVFVDALEALGYSRERLLEAARLGGPALADPDGRVPCATVSALFAAATGQKPLPNFGARLAQATPAGAYALLDYLVLTSETVGAAIAQSARYLRLTEAPYTMELKTGEDPIRVVYDALNAFTAEYAITLTILRCREGAENGCAVLSARFTHALGDRSAMEHILRCPVYGQASWAGIEFDRETWNTPLRRRDPVLRSLLEEHAANIAARIPGDGPAALEIRQVIASRMSKGETRIEDAARALATSKRSLQRHLAVAGLSYQQLVDEVRRDAAAEYLADPALSVAEIAYLLGYSEAAPFHRAFRRWNGTTPQQFRASLVAQR
jgi:AraC-like DNA-binding protein